MSKYELKEKLTELADNMESAAREIATPPADEEAAAIRDCVCVALAEAYAVIRREIHHIY